MRSHRLIRNISLALALISVAALFYIDKEIATRYQQSDGKTKAMFGIIELSQFSYKYLILIPAILSIVLAGIVIWKRKFSLLDIGIFSDWSYSYYWYSDSFLEINNLSK